MVVGKMGKKKNWKKSRRASDPQPPSKETSVPHSSHSPAPAPPSDAAPSDESPTIVADGKTLIFRKNATINRGDVNTFHVGDVYHHDHTHEEHGGSTGFEEMEVEVDIEPLPDSATTGEVDADATPEADPRILKLMQRIFANCHNVEKWKENTDFCAKLKTLFEEQGALLSKAQFDSVHFFVRVNVGPNRDAFIQACNDRDSTFFQGLTSLLVTPELEEAAGMKLRLRLAVKDTPAKDVVSAPKGTLALYKIIYYSHKPVIWEATELSL
ncbi:uncharacterized protein LOC129265793 [Lytechinus pictus]|uniref:uncharacterized protein LOC129265793 n=1 Tax=Lytechinus pictus TaxID=7653 RepID=UPI0030B9C6AD